MAADPRISVGKNKCLPQKIKQSAEKKFRKKMQGCFMQFLHLIFVKKLQLQGALPPDPHWGCCPWTPTGGLLRPPGPHFSADFSIFNSHACWYFLGSVVSFICQLYFFFSFFFFLSIFRLIQASASKAEDPGFDSGLRHGDFSGSSHSSDLKIGTPVATLPGTWRCQCTGWPGVSIL